MEQIKGLGIEIDTPNFNALSQDLEKKLEAICQQSNISAAQSKLQEFISTANSIKNTLNQLRNQIEPPLRAKGEKIRAKLEKELRAQGEAMGKEIEAKLRAQAEQEAQIIKEKLKKQIRQEIEVELKNRFAGQKNINQSYVQKVAQQLIQEKIQKARTKAQAELQAKYQRLAKQERERITKRMEEKADKIGGEEKRKLEKIRDSFLDLETNLESVSQTKMTRWLAFKEKAIQKKKEILLSIIDIQIDKAKELIMAHQEEINKAREQGKNVPSVEELIAQLEKDKKDLINQLANTTLNEETIREAVKELQKKWERKRAQLALVKKQGARQIVYRVNQKFKRTKMMTRADFDKMTQVVLLPFIECDKKILHTLQQAKKQMEEEGKTVSPGIKIKVKVGPYRTKESMWYPTKYELQSSISKLELQIKALEEYIEIMKNIFALKEEFANYQQNLPPEVKIEDLIQKVNSLNQYKSRLWSEVRYKIAQTEIWPECYRGTRTNLLKQLFGY